MHLEYDYAPTLPHCQREINDRDAETPCLLLSLNSIHLHPLETTFKINGDTDGDREIPRKKRDKYVSV